MNASIPEEMDSAEPVPDVLLGYASVRSQGGTSALDLERFPDATEQHHGRQADRREASRVLASMGFTIIAESRLGIAVQGAPGAFEELTGGRVVTRERLLYAEGGRERYVTYVDVVGDKQPASWGVGAVESPNTRVEGVLVERPRVPMAVFPSPIPPLVSKFHLRVPDDVAVGLGATPAHRAGYTGDGVLVAMVDTGQYAHPFFAAHRYNVRRAISVVPGANPAKDPSGHGTGESANIFAIAPNAVLQPIRASNNQGKLVGAITGFLYAKTMAPAPRILTNSWGGDGPFPPTEPLDEYDKVWALEILDAIEQGIFVVFSAGNGHFSLEPQVPGVMAAGGVHMSVAADFQASNYASGYDSPWFAGVRVPDVCGLVGLLPRAQYIMLPVSPGSDIDTFESQATTNDSGDGTSSNDGWALFSGTSAAAPQIAGVAALILGVRPNLTPAQVTECIKATAQDIWAGRCHPRFNYPAEVGSDRATGNGLGNSAAAVQYALDRFPQ